MTITFSERAVEAAAAKLTDDGVFERDEWYDHPVVKRKRRQALKMARSALSAALAVDGLALVPLTCAKIEPAMRLPGKVVEGVSIAALVMKDQFDMLGFAAKSANRVYEAALTAASDGEVG